MRPLLLGGRGFSLLLRREHEQGAGAVHDQFAKDFYSSNQWKRCREALKIERSGMCEECRKKGLIVTSDLEAHHIIPLTPENISDPSISLNLDNLMLLCKDCHAKQHAPDRRWHVDPCGHITA